jgi:hypothetical protein
MELDSDACRQLNELRAHLAEGPTVESFYVLAVSAHLLIFFVFPRSIHAKQGLAPLDEGEAFAQLFFDTLVEILCASSFPSPQHIAAFASLAQSLAENVCALVLHMRERLLMSVANRLHVPRVCAALLASAFRA